MNHEKRIKNLTTSFKKLSREQLERCYAIMLLDWAETDTYVREKCKGILTDFEINGDSYGVPDIESIVDSLIEKIKNK